VPELPEVETVCRGMAPLIMGSRIVSVVQRKSSLRIPFPQGFSRSLAGRMVTEIERRAKYILLTLDNGMVLLVHLGMSGTLVVSGYKDIQPGKHDHVIIHFKDGTILTYTDPRRFGLMTLVPKASIEQHRLLRKLGLEPLGRDFTGPVLESALSGRKMAIKVALLDQTIVAGLGNIYACEALYRAGISPRRLANSVKGLRAHRLAIAIRNVLNDAIHAGGSTLRDYVQSTGSIGYFQHEFSVYGCEHKPCPNCVCSTGVKRIVQGGRSTFFCSRHQR